MTHDIEVIRKAYNKILEAMSEAKEAGDTERLAKLKPDYTAIKEMLSKAKEEEKLAKAEQRDMMAAYRDIVAGLKDNLKELTQDLRESQAEANALREQLKAARKMIGDLKHENARLTDENRTLSAPPPVEEYRRAQLMPMPEMPAFDMNEMMAMMDAITTPRTP